MPDKYEPGSHNAIGIIGLSEGVKWVADQTVQNLHQHDMELVGTFLEGIGDIRGLTYYGPRGVKIAPACFPSGSKDTSRRNCRQRWNPVSASSPARESTAPPWPIEADRHRRVRRNNAVQLRPVSLQQDVSFAADALSEVAGAVRNLVRR